jgi:thiamine kinase
MSSNPLEGLAARWVPGSGRVDIRATTSGLVNESCRVDRDGRSFSLRVASGNADLGLDRDWECRVLHAAAAAGLAPGIEHCRPLEGLLVARWVGGRAWRPEETRRAENIDAIAGLLRRVHALPIPQPPRVMSAAAWIRHYSQAAARRDLTLASGVVDLGSAAGAQLALLAALPPASAVLCHSDLHLQNAVVTDAGGLVLLDWEYAHVSDGFWDLAGWIANNEWEEAPATRLLTRYLCRDAVPHERERLRLQTWLYDYVCLLWSEIYINQRPGGASEAVAARAACVAMRLHESSGSRAGQVPAH